MNRTELVSAVADRAGVSKTDADGVLSALAEVVGETVAGGDKVQLPGFLSFEKTQRAARTGRNPRTGEELQIPASNAVKGSAGSKLKAAVQK